MHRRFLCTLALAALLCSQATHAQEEPESQPVPHDQPFVLHVYANLMQFPTLVLSSQFRPIPPVPKNKFAITLDGGPIFHPTQMRLEGDDALALAVLLDATGSQRKLIEHFADSFSELAPAFLHPADHVTLYAQDCKFMRSLLNQPADRELLHRAVIDALNTPGLHGPKPHSSCGESLPHWDTLSLIAADLAHEPGRRVILVVSLGKESKSKTAFPALSQYIGGQGTAVFRLRDEYDIPDQTRNRISSLNARAGFIPLPEDLFAELCAETGGMDLKATSRNLTKQLQEFVKILRGRYIVEFPRPDIFSGAHHTIEITMPGTTNIVRSTGGSAPMSDPALLTDPNTLPSTPSPAKLGTRRPIGPERP